MYRDFAFISYSSKDTEWGKRLQRKLENYRMPATICREHGWQRKPINPVFFAPTDIQPGGLTSELQERLQASRNLIVICSPHSAQSDWVSREIEFFHQLGRTEHIHFFIVDGDAAKALWYMQDMRKLATAEKKPGIDYSDPMTVMLYENLLSVYRKSFGDRLPEFTLGGKKYIVIAMNKWNLEMPLMGWLGGFNDSDGEERTKGLKLLYGEDGKVYDDMHGEMNYSFNFTKDGFVPQEGYNVRMITVTPEQRQKMVAAYHSYMKKHKKDKQKEK